MRVTQSLHAVIASVLGVPAAAARRSGVGSHAGLALVAAASLSAALMAPQQARGATVVADAQHVVIAQPAGRVIVDRSPFRLSFQDASGRTVLSEVPNTALPAASVNLSPQPGSLRVLPERAVYQPLVFEVGGEASLQYNQSLYTGNLLVAGGAGAAFAARQVTAISPRDGGAALDVATTDPTRTLHVLVTPDGHTAFRVRAAVDGPGGVAAIGDAFSSGHDEAFHGFGGRHNAIDERGQDLYSYIAQENFGSDKYGPYFAPLPGSGGNAYMFPNGPLAAYYAHNGFISSRPYGFLLNQSQLTRFRLATDRPDAWQVSAVGSSLDYTVAIGPGATAVRALTGINGSQRVPPAWSEGPFPYRAVSLNGETPDTYRAKVLDDIAHVERDHLGVTAYDYEGWHALGDQAVRRINARLHHDRVHPVGYLRAFVSNDGAFFDDAQLYQQAVDGGYLATTATGQPYVYDEATSPAGVIDFTNPAAVRWWERRVDHMLDLGFDGFMEDFGEQVLTDMHFHDGSTGVTMHNLYPVIYHRVTQEILNRYQRAHPQRGPIFAFTRAGFSGRPGAAAYEGANFPGDETADYFHGSGLQSLASDMLNRAILGSLGFTTDIGGYIDSLSGPTDAELFLRWTEWSTLTPFLRVHNDSNDTTKMPWSFGPQVEKTWRRLAALHHRALPLIRRLWTRFRATGVPPTSPLWLTAPGDGRAAKQDQEWMLGPDVLVAPVVIQGANARSVYFPAGCWNRPGTSEAHNGPASATVPAPVDQVPYFFRCKTHPFADAAARRAPRRSTARRRPRGRRRARRRRARYTG